MTTTRPAREVLYTRLVEVLGHNEADTLMQYLPTDELPELATRADIDRLISRFDGFEHGMETFQHRMDGFAQRMEGFDRRMDGFEQRMEGFDRRMDGFEQRMEGLDKRMDGLDKRMELFEKDLEHQRELMARFDKRMESFETSLLAFGGQLQATGRTYIVTTAGSIVTLALAIFSSQILL